MNVGSENSYVRIIWLEFLNIMIHSILTDDGTGDDAVQGQPLVCGQLEDPYYAIENCELGGFVSEDDR